MIKKILFVFLPLLCLLPFPSVSALITGESYSESSTNKYMLARLYTTNNTLPLYGLIGSSSSCSSSSPDLNCFYKGNSSLFTYEDPSVANFVWTTLRFYISPSLVNGKTYNVSMKYEVGSTIDPTNWFGDQENAGQGTYSNYQNTCTGSSPKTCYVTFTLKVNASIEYLDIKRKANNNVNGYLMIQQINKLYMPQITEVSSSGGGNTTIIVDNKDLENKVDQTNENLEDINDTISSDNVDDFSDTINSFDGFLEENSTITKLITLPVTLYSSILNNINNTCVPFNLGTLYGSPLILPCINIGNYLGASLWGMIDLIISGFAIYSISKKFIKIFNNFSTLREGDVLDD